MGSGDFGGDRSVQWRIVGGNVRGNSVVQRPEPPRGHRHEGVDDTEDQEDKWFTVTVQRPKTGWPAALVDALQKFVAAPGASVSFDVPIEDLEYLRRHGIVPPVPAANQIKVDWPSRP